MNNNFLKNMLEPQFRENTEQNQEKKSSLPSKNESLETNPENQLEKSLYNIEQQSEKLNRHQANLEQMIASMSPEESHYIAQAIEQDPKSQGLLKSLQEKLAHLNNAGHHAQEHLSEHYNPKVVGLIHSTGKAIGGITGLFSGMPLGLAGSATGAVVGAKAGGYGLLKLFEKTVHKLPDSFQEKIKRKDPLESVHQNQESLTRELEKRSLLEGKMKLLSQEAQNLDPESQKKFAELMSQDPEVLSATQKLDTLYEKYHDVYEKFEKDFPNAAAFAELGVHTAIGAGLHASGIGTAAVIAMDMVAAAGGAEQMTKHLISAGNHIKQKIISIQEKIDSFNNPKQETQNPVFII
jgi:hypothetical protein